LSKYLYTMQLALANLYEFNVLQEVTSFNHSLRALQQTLSAPLTIASYGKIQSIWDYLFSLYTLLYPWGTNLCRIIELEMQQLAQTPEVRGHEIGVRRCLICGGIAAISCLCPLQVWYCSKSCKRAHQAEHKPHCEKAFHSLDEDSNTLLRCALLAKRIYQSRPITNGKTELILTDTSKEEDHLMLYHAGFYIRKLQQRTIKIFGAKSIGRAAVFAYLNSCLTTLSNSVGQPHPLAQFARVHLDYFVKLFSVAYPWGADIAHQMLTLIVRFTGITPPMVRDRPCIVCHTNYDLIICPCDMGITYCSLRCNTIFNCAHHEAICCLMSMTQDSSNETSFIPPLLKQLDNRIVLPRELVPVYRQFKLLHSWAESRDAQLADMIHVGVGILRYLSIDRDWERFHNYLDGYFDYFHALGVNLHRKKYEEILQTLYQYLQALERLKSREYRRVCAVCYRATTKSCSCHLDIYFCSVVCQRTFYPKHEAHCREARKLGLASSPSLMKQIRLG
jgi:hypothetical protein